MVLQYGELIEWNDERGFGFIRPDDAGEPIFVHISKIARIATRPRLGDRVSFTSGIGRQGKPAAANVRIAGANPLDTKASMRGVTTHPTRHGWSRPRFYLSGLLLFLLLAGLVTGAVPYQLVAIYAVMSVISAALYFDDKRLAKTGGWRTSEVRLHAIDLACGIIGGLLAQEIFRHKTAKQPFVALTWLIAAVHGLWLVGLVSGRISLAELASFIPG